VCQFLHLNAAAAADMRQSDRFESGRRLPHQHSDRLVASAEASFAPQGSSMTRTKSAWAGRSSVQLGRDLGPQRRPGAGGAHDFKRAAERLDPIR
jgi:hypothetical protein